MFCWLSDCIYSPNENICRQILMMLMPTRWLFDTWNVFCLNNLFQQFPRWCWKFRNLEFFKRNAPGLILQCITFYENLYTLFWVGPEETWCHQECLGIQWRLLIIDKLVQLHKRCFEWCSLCIYDIDGLVQERRTSIANALELSLSCTNSSIGYLLKWCGWIHIGYYVVCWCGIMLYFFYYRQIWYGRSFLKLTSNFRLSFIMISKRFSI